MNYLNNFSIIWCFVVKLNESAMDLSKKNDKYKYKLTILNFYEVDKHRSDRFSSIFSPTY